jgi:hypothetical protein
MTDMSVELRLRGTFIDFHIEPSQSARNYRSSSAPPYVQPKLAPEVSEDDGELAYLEGLVERASQLTLKKPTEGWTCVCKVRSAASAAFCWSCGKSKDTLRVWQHPTTQYFDYTTKVPISLDESMNLSRVGVFSVSTTDGGSSRVSTQSLKDLDNDDSSVSEHGVGALDGNALPITTLMISALPVRLTIDQLLASINSAGFCGTYDLVYMPYRSVKKRGKVQHGSPGYAFVNFKSAELASQFASVFDGYSFSDVGSDRTAVLKPATSQGYKANLALHVREKKQHGSVITFP